MSKILKNKINNFEKSEFVKKPVSQNLIYYFAGIISATMISLILINIIPKNNSKKTVSTREQSIPSIVRVTALGRLQPKGEVIKLSVANQPNEQH